MHREFVSGKDLTPQRMVSGVRKLVADWDYGAISMGYPGPVKNGQPVLDPWNLGKGWVHFNFKRAFKCPIKIVNDAAMQALGGYRRGKMLFLGLGTGLGSTLIVEGHLAPLELAHLPYRSGTFEDYVGLRGLEKHGKKKWRKYVFDVVERLAAAFEPDEIVLGGGNTHKLKKLPPLCRAGTNENAFRGGFRLWEKPGTVALFLLFFLLAGVRAQAQPAQTDASTNAVSSTETSSQTSVTNTVTVVPNGAVSSSHSVDLNPFQLVLPRSYLFGTWNGYRTKLEDAGFTPTLSFVTDMAGNVTGGKSQGFSEANNLGLDLFFDLQKLASLNGASFLVTMSLRGGSSLSADHVGNVFTIQQVYGGQTFHLIDVAYQQKLLNDQWEFRIGRIAVGDDFLVSPYNWLFMQNGFDGNPVGIFFNSPGMTAYPNATWGAMAKFRPTKRTYLMGGVYNGDPSIRDIDHNGADMSMDGPVFVIGEVGYQRNGLPGDTGLIGNYEAGFWYDNSVYTDFRTVGYSASPSIKRGNWGVYTLVDQVLIAFNRTNSTGLGIFASALISPDVSISQIPYFFTAGFAARGIFELRPRDVAGLGVVFGQFSSDLHDAQAREQLFNPTVAPQDHEIVLEGTYRMYFIRNSVFIQPDIQYIINPGATGKLDNALVLGCQIGMNF
jgi:polyphosphate glucokinase